MNGESKSVALLTDSMNPPSLSPRPALLQNTEHMYKAMAIGQKMGLNFDLEPNSGGYTLTADGNGRRFFWTGKTPENVFEQAAKTLGRELDQRR